MTAEQFVYWLQGFVELSPDGPNPVQWKQIREHLQTVFHKVTPNVGFPNYAPGVRSPHYVPPMPNQIPVKHPLEIIR